MTNKNAEPLLPVELGAGKVKFAQGIKAGRWVFATGVILTGPNEPESQTNVSAFLQGLQEAGWAVGRNIRIDYRWSGNDRSRLNRDAADLIALSPDVVLAGTGGTTQALRRVSRTIPIVFAQNIDPLGSGSVASLSRPGTNATGFTQFEYSLSAKWLELLREIAPGLARVAVFRDSEGFAGIGQWAVIQAAAGPLGLELSPADPNDVREMERRCLGPSTSRECGLIVAVSSGALNHRDQILALAARYKLPAIYPYRHFIAAGGLASYGVDVTSLYRRAAGYVDRILKGEKPADLPVQNPTKYEFAINLKTAKALGLTVSPTLLMRADEVIE